MSENETEFSDFSEVISRAKEHEARAIWGMPRHITKHTAVITNFFRRRHPVIVLPW